MRTLKEFGYILFPGGLEGWPRSLRNKIGKSGLGLREELDKEPNTEVQDILKQQALTQIIELATILNELGVFFRFPTQSFFHPEVSRAVEEYAKLLSISTKEAATKLIKIGLSAVHAHYSHCELANELLHAIEKSQKQANKLGTYSQRPGALQR